jgi:hypothetical protein
MIDNKSITLLALRAPKSAFFGHGNGRMRTGQFVLREATS